MGRLTRCRGAPGRGFTLIELLKVVAVLAILAAVLFPVLAQVREKACQTACMNKLRQMSTAMRLYSDDNDERFPPVLGRQSARLPLFPETWMGHLQAYLGTTAVFVDAASGYTNQNWHASADLLRNYSFSPSARVTGRPALRVCAAPFGTAMWEGLGGFSGPPIGGYRESVPGWSQAQVARPAETIVVCDHLAFDWGLLEGKFYYPAPRHLREPNLELPDGGWAPEGLINAVFVDGHARSLRHERFWEILPAYTHRNYSTSDVFRYFWPYE